MLTSNFYLILYYNSHLWLIPSLKPQLKQQILQSSLIALKTCTPNFNNFMSFEQTHGINKCGIPRQFLKYKHSLLMYKIWNDVIFSQEWLALNFQQNFNVRSTTVKVFETSKSKVGKNIAVNCLTVINGLIEYDWLNLSIDAYKIKCKA